MLFTDSEYDTMALKNVMEDIAKTKSTQDEKDTHNCPTHTNDIHSYNDIHGHSDMFWN